jgi:RNA polymerase sigma-70 factor (ECF subfamily)
MGAAPGHTTAHLQHWLELMQAGDDDARQELINYACERLRKLTHRMLRGYPRVRRWEQTADVLQNALLRLYRALADVTPESLRHFYNLAALQIRRELLDLAKHHLGPEGPGARHHSDAPGRPGDDEPGALEEVAAAAAEPTSLEGWTEFHAQVEALSEEQREVVNLLWYEGLTQHEAAEVLGLSPRTVLRRWQAARLRLYQALHGDRPE